MLIAFYKNGIRFLKLLSLLTLQSQYRMFKNDALKSLQIAINTAFFYPYSSFILCLPIHISIFITYTYRRNILNCSRCCTMTELFHGCETILTRTTLYTTKKFLTNFPTKNMCYYLLYNIMEAEIL